MQICTVVARNYLAAARVLARSFHDHHPGGKCWTLIIDDVDHEVDDAAEPFEVIRPEELEIDAWHRMTAGYSVVELSTAVKPWLLRHLLDVSGAERITFLDPDVQIFDSLMEVEELLRVLRGRAQPASDGAAASRRPSAGGDRHPGLWVVQSRVRRVCRQRRSPRSARLVGRTARDRLPRRAGARLFRRSALDGPRSRADPEHVCAPGSRLQRRVLEPAAPRGQAHGLRLRRRRPTAAVLSFLRL